MKRTALALSLLLSTLFATPALACDDPNSPFSLLPTKSRNTTIHSGQPVATASSDTRNQQMGTASKQ